MKNKNKSDDKADSKVGNGQNRMSADHLDLATIWPQEREFMERPDRLKYVRKLVQPTACVFCEAVSAGVLDQGLVLFVGEHVFATLNKYPYNSGHVLVLPKRHCGHILQLSEEEQLELNWLLRETFRIVERAYQCEGVNLGMNHGKVAGAGIPEHLHWHVIPRFFGDTNFFPIIAETKVLPESLEMTFSRLRPEFIKLEKQKDR